MKIVIDVPDRILYGIKNGITRNGSVASQIVLNAVKNGTVLPKGHGQLVDMDAVLRYIKEPLTKAEFMIRMSAEKVLEADKEATDGSRD